MGIVTEKVLEESRFVNTQANNCRLASLEHKITLNGGGGGGRGRGKGEGGGGVLCKLFRNPDPV